MSAFLVDTKTPGSSVGTVENKVASELADVRADLPKRGGPGTALSRAEGASLAIETLHSGRVAAAPVGIAEEAFRRREPPCSGSGSAGVADFRDQWMLADANGDRRPVSTYEAGWRKQAIRVCGGVAGKLY
jgi:hypothetical protein